MMIPEIAKNIEKKNHIFLGVERTFPQFLAHCIFRR